MSSNPPTAFGNDAEHPKTPGPGEATATADASAKAATKPATPDAKPRKPKRARRTARRPGSVRRAVFGTIWLLVGIAVAVSLVKLAFFNAEEPEAQVPTGQLESPTVTVARGTVVNEFTITGSVSADAGVPIRATDPGTVTVLFVNKGDRIEKGAPLFEVREEIGQTDPEPIGEPDPNTGAQQLSAPEPIYQYHTIVAPESGVLSALTPLPRMQVSVGEEVGNIGPGTFTVVANLSADLQYRILDAPTEASVTIPGGPAPFSCSSLKIGAPENTGQQPPQQAAPPPVSAYGDPYAYADPGIDGGTSPTTGEIRCAVPAEQRVFAGLSAEVHVVAGQADDVLVVPTTAVRGDFATGTVYVVHESGDEPEEVTVELGLTDGTSIEITSGLNEGDTVLEYVPSEVPMYEESFGA